MARLDLRLLGGFRARLGDGPALVLPAKAQALLAYLAIRPGQAHPRDKLAALLWGDTGDARARDSLRHVVAVLRKALDGSTSGVLVAEGQTYALDSAAAEIDVVRFERTIADGTPEALERAAALYQGDLLEGLAVSEARFEEWFLAERERLRELAVEALAKLLAHHTEAGGTERAIQTATRLLVLDPLQEVVHRALMRLYVQQGRRGTALKQFQVCVSVLQRELGAEPEPETKHLYQQLLRERAAVVANEGGATVVTSEPAAAAMPARGPALANQETPLIGRGPELEVLREALAGAVAGHGGVLALVGEAGIGKSRLVEALATAAHERGVTVLLGRSHESMQILAFGPWVDALRAAVSEEVSHALNPVWRAELCRLLPELAAPGLPTPGDDHLRLFEAVVQLLERLAERRPVHLILEDLHWADEMSLRVLPFVGRRAVTRRIMVAVTAREEELPDVPALRAALEELQRAEHFEQRRLSPLSRPDTIELVRSRARVGQDEAAFARLGERVWSVSEGNPFVAVEMIRAHDEGDRSVASRDLAVPRGVRELVTSRLDRLGESARTLVSAAAVIGREFEFALVQRATGLEEATAAEGVEELVRRRILQGVGEGFDFTHDRIREVIYHGLLSPRRALLHARIAGALESLYGRTPDPNFAALGAHYQAGEVWDKAVHYLRQAGAQAVQRSAHREAVACFEQALAAHRRRPESRDASEQALDLLLDLRNSLEPLADLGRVQSVLREAESLATTVGDPRRLGRVLLYQTSHFRLIGDNGRAVEAARRALAIAPEGTNPALAAGVKAYLGAVHHARGEHRQGLAVLRTALASLQDEEFHQRFGVVFRPFVVWCYTGQAWSSAELGNFAEAMALGDEGVRVAEETDHPHSLIVGLSGPGFVHLRRGSIHAAIASLERAVGLCQGREVPLYLPWIAAFLGYAYALSGRLHEAAPHLEQSIELAASAGIMADQSLRHALLAEAYLMAGRTEHATATARLALDLSRRHEERGIEAWSLRLFGEIAQRGDRSETANAERSYRAARVLAEGLGMRPLVAHCHLGLGALHAKAGRPHAAQTELSIAMGLYREMDMPSWLAQAENALAATARA